MAFVDELPTRQLAVPDEEGEWFEVRELSWRELDECRREQDRKFMGRVREMPAELLKTVGEMEDGAAPDVENPAASSDAVDAARKENARLAAVESFDREMLVSKSVVGWSYERHFQATLLGKLDEKTFTWLFLEIAALYVEGDAQRKAVSADSMST